MELVNKKGDANQSTVSFIAVKEEVLLLCYVFVPSLSALGNIFVLLFCSCEILSIASIFLLIKKALQPSEHQWVHLQCIDRYVGDKLS